MYFAILKYDEFIWNGNDVRRLDVEDILLFTCKNVFHVEFMSCAFVALLSYDSNFFEVCRRTRASRFHDRFESR